MTTAAPIPLNFSLPVSDGRVPVETCAAWCRDQFARAEFGSTNTGVSILILSILAVLVGNALYTWAEDEDRRRLGLFLMRYSGFLTAAYLIFRVFFA